MKHIQENPSHDTDAIELKYFSLDNLILQKEVGSGSFGKVYQVKDKITGKIYAAKISRQSITEISHDSIINLFREVNIISKLNHPSVLKFIGYSPTNFKGKPKPVIITEYASNGSLDSLIHLQRNSPSQFTISPTRKLIIIYGIASSMLLSSFTQYHS